MARRRMLVGGLGLIAYALSACVTTTTGSSTTTGPFSSVPKNCTAIPAATSPDKIDLINALATAFNSSTAARQGGCVFIQPASLTSGGVETALEQGWDESVNGPKPAIWLPAGSVWGQVLNERLHEKGESNMVGVGKPFMRSPLVIAMPKPMAQALGWPNKSLGWSDILGLVNNGKGWGAYGHPEWGKFKLGKTNPHISTSGLNQLIAQAYAATGKTSGLSLEDLDKPDVEAFTSAVESAVVHYGDNTLTFMNNWYAADQRGTALTYVSAVAMEEKSVIDYNQGNPDGILQPGEQPRPPRVPLVAIYPKEGTLFSDHPFYVLNADWVTDAQRNGAQRFETFLEAPENQRQVLKYNIRPGNPSVPIQNPITTANGVDPNQPQALVDMPAPPVVTRLLDKWDQQRKKAQVLLVLDISGSMQDDANPDDPSEGTKLDLAKQAAINALDLFSDDDEVGLRVFSTDLGDQQDQNYLDLVPFGRVGDIRETLKSRIRDLFPTNGTPLYDVTLQSYKDVEAKYDPARINAIVLLTDGFNDDGNQDDDSQQLQQLLSALQAGSEGEGAKPIRIFPIGYGHDADIPTLREIAAATSANVYDASNPGTINKVLTAVISNF